MALPFSLHHLLAALSGHAVVLPTSPSTSGAAERPEPPSKLSKLSSELITTEWPRGSLQKIQEAKIAVHAELERISALEKSAKTITLLQEALRESIIRWFSEIGERASSASSQALVSPEKLSSSATFSALSSMVALLRSMSTGSRSFNAVFKGGRVLSWALLGLLDASRKVFATAFPGEAFLLPIITWMGDRVCRSDWGIVDPWAPSEGSSPDFAKVEDCGPLPIAAKRDAPMITSLILDHGAPINGLRTHPLGALPVVAAFFDSSPATFRLLVERGADLIRETGRSEDKPLFANLVARGEKGKSTERLDTDMLKTMFELRPELLREEWIVGGQVLFDVLHAAVASKLPEVVAFLIEKGVSIRYEKVAVTFRGNKCGRYATAYVAMYHPCGPVLESLLDRHKILDDWKRKYNLAAKQDMAYAFARLAVSAFPKLDPSFAHYEDELVEPIDKSYLSMVDLILSKGFNYLWEGGQNSLLSYLFFRRNRLILSPENTITLLRKFLAAGADVNHVFFSSLSKALPAELSHLAAARGWKELFSFSVKEAGCDINRECKDTFPTGEEIQGTPLGLAIAAGKKEFVLWMLKELKPTVCFPEKSALGQPLTGLFGSPVGTDAVSLAIAKELAAADPLLIEKVDWDRGGPDFYIKDPVFLAIEAGFLKTAEFLLSLPGAKEACRRFHKVPLSEPRGSVEFMSAAQYCALNLKWDALTLLLNHDAAVVTQQVGAKASVVGIVNNMIRDRFPGLPSRGLIAQIKAAAQRERAAPSTAKVKQQPKVSGATTNTFEDPSLKAVTTEAQEKKKAKKRERKKKAKAKKMAAAQAVDAYADAGAGGGGAARESSSSDSSGSEESSEEEVEPGKEHLVDSRNAPDLTVMLAARRAAREKAAAEEEEKKKAKEAEERAMAEEASSPVSSDVVSPGARLAAVRAAREEEEKEKKDRS
jgi:hypothetical protein